MNVHCYVYPLRSPPDHISILSSTYNDNLKEFITNGNIQTLIADDREVARMFSQNRPLHELLVDLHTHWNIGSLPGGVGEEGPARDVQLKRLKAFQYIYNLATLNDRPITDRPYLTQSFNNSDQVDSVYYLDAIPRTFATRYDRPDTIVINHITLNYCTDIIGQYPYLTSSVIPSIESNWNDAARERYLDVYGTTNEEGVFSIPMLVSRRAHARQPRLDAGHLIGGYICNSNIEFTYNWTQVVNNMMTKLQHHYTQKVFGVDTRTDPTPIQPHINSKTGAVRFRYFEYLTEFQNDRTPERLIEKLSETQEGSDSEENSNGIPKISQIHGDIYYRMQYLTVNATDSWLVVYNQLDEYSFDGSDLLDGSGGQLGIIQNMARDDHRWTLPHSDDSVSSNDSDSIQHGRFFGGTGLLPHRIVHHQGDGLSQTSDSDDNAPDLFRGRNVIRRQLDIGGAGTVDNSNFDGGSRFWRRRQVRQAETPSRSDHMNQTLLNFLHPNTNPPTYDIDSLSEADEALGSFKGLTSPIYDILEIPEGTRLKYISYWEQYDVVLCYCDSATSIPIRNLRNIPDVLAPAVTIFDDDDDRGESIPQTLRPDTPRPFYVYLPRRLVSCSVLDVEQQAMALVSLSNPAWGSPEFYTKYIIRPALFDNTQLEGGDLITPNGKCNSTGWRSDDITRAIQFSGITLNHDTFKQTRQCLDSYKTHIQSNSRSLRQLYPTISGMSAYRLEEEGREGQGVWKMARAEFLLKVRLMREIRKYKTGVMFTRSEITWGEVTPAIFGINGQSEPVQRNPNPPVRTYFGIVARSTEGLNRFIVPYQNLPDSGYRLTAPSRDQISQYLITAPNSRWLLVKNRGFPQLNLTLTLAADCLHNRNNMATRIQRRSRSSLPSTAPQNEWQRLCSQIRNNETDTRLLRKIIVENSQKHRDPNRHLTLEGLAGLTKRRLCKLLVMQQMKDDRVKVQGIKKLLERHRTRQTELAEHYPEPPGLCTNLADSMDIVDDQISNNINNLCLISGKCQEIKNFFDTYKDTTYREFGELVEQYNQLIALLIRQETAANPTDYQNDIDRLTEQLGDFVEKLGQFKTNVLIVFNVEYYGRDVRVSPLTLMGHFWEEPPNNMFSLYAYDQAFRDGGFHINQIPIPISGDGVQSVLEIFRSDIQQSKDNWERDQGLTYSEWEGQYPSVNWDSLFQKPLDLFVTRKLRDTIRDYTKYLNSDNPNYEGSAWNLTKTDIQEICTNYGRESPTYQESQPGDYFIVVRSDFQSRCVHRSVLNAGEVEGVLCEWVAPESHPDALTDPNFDTGMYLNRETGSLAVLQPRVPQRLFYPITLSETNQGIDTAYFDQADITTIRNNVEQPNGSIHVFYMSDGTSVRMGNCEGDFGVSQTHGQRDVAFQYRIRYHREISPERVEFLSSQPTVQFGVAQEENPAQVDQAAELLDLRQQQQQFNRQTMDSRGDRGILRQINRNKRYVTRKIEWLTMEHDATPEKIERLHRQIHQDYVNIQQQIDDLEPESEREGLHQAVVEQWSSFLTMIGDVH